LDRRLIPVTYIEVESEVRVIQRAPGRYSCPYVASESVGGGGKLVWAKLSSGRFAGRQLNLKASILRRLDGYVFILEFTHQVQAHLD